MEEVAAALMLEEKLSRDQKLTRISVERLPQRVPHKRKILREAGTIGSSPSGSQHSSGSRRSTVLSLAMHFNLNFTALVLFFLFAPMTRLEAKSDKTNVLNKFKINFTSFCQPPKSGAVEDCEDNYEFVIAGDSCLDKVKSESEKVRKELEALLLKGTKGKGQEEKFESTTSNYTFAQDSLKYLIGVTEMAIREVDRFKADLHPPEDYDSPDIAPDQPKFLMSQECYGESILSLDDIKSELSDELNGLKTALATFNTKGKESDAIDSNLDNRSNSKKMTIVKSGEPAGENKKPIRKGIRKSDVTGTPPEQKKK